MSIEGQEVHTHDGEAWLAGKCETTCAGYGTKSFPGLISSVDQESGTITIAHEGQLELRRPTWSARISWSKP